MVLVRNPWALIQAVTTADTIHPNTIRTACWGAMVKRDRTRGAGELKVLEKVGDISSWLQGITVLRSEDSLGFEVPESLQLDAWCQVLGLGPRPSGRSRPAFGRQWIFTPELYLVTAGTFLGSNISSMVVVLLVLLYRLLLYQMQLVLQQCHFPPISFKPIASRTPLKTSLTVFTEFS